MEFMKRLEDLRFVIGLFFGIVAVLLVVASFTQTGPEVAINSRVGAFMGAFALAMLTLSHFSHRDDVSNGA